MPAALPAIAAAAASYGATAVLGTAFASTFVGSLIVAGAGFLASSIVSQLLPKPDAADNAGLINQPGAGRTFQVRQPSPPRQVVLGRIKTSGPIMFVHSMDDDTGRADGYFYMQIALAGHRCKRIGDVYLNDALSSDARFSGLVRFGKNLGTSTQVEDADFLAELGAPLFGDHWLRGITNIACRFKGSAEAFPNGLPNVSTIVWGADEVYDPRTGTTGWSNNPALVYAWWKTWQSGMKVDYADLDEDTLIDAANVCDERERVAPGTTTFSADATANTLALTAEHARSLDVGDGVRVSSSGTLPGGLAAATTYYVIPTDDGAIKLATSVANAFAETAIDLSSAGTGTLTLTYWDEARYKLNGSFTLDQDKETIKTQLLSAMLGFDIEVGGMWFIHAGAAATPTQVLDEGDLRAGMKTVPKRSMRDKFNGVRARFVNPDNFWQPSDAPPLLNATYLAEDNGIALYEEVSFPFTTSARAVQRMMKIHLERNRRQRSVFFPAQYTAMPLRPLSGCYVSNTRYGWDQEQHVVMGWKLTADLGVDLVLQADSADVYAWDYTTDEQTVAVPQGVTLPDPSVIVAPAVIDVSLPIDPTYSRLNVDFTEVKSIWFDGYDVEFKPTGFVTWSSSGRIYTNKVSLVTNEAVDIRVRAVTKNGSLSAWTQDDAPEPPSAVIATGTTLDWTDGAGAAEVQIFKSDTDLTAATLFDTVLAGVETAVVDDDAYYWLRSVNLANNVSNETVSVTVGTPGAADGGGGDGSDGSDGGDGSGDGGDGDE